MKILLILLLLFTISCVEVEKRELVNTQTIRKEINCTYTGYCYKCGMGFNGKFSCGYGVSSMCYGTQRALVTEKSYRLYYTNGKQKVRTRDEIKKVLSKCK